MEPAAAKQFLVSKVLEEAERSHIQLSEVEHKMLYFTEQYPTLPDIIDVNAQFERDYDGEEYEAKIARLLTSARKRDETSASREREWKDAIDALKVQDHYILVMVGQAFGLGAGQRHPFRDYGIYVAVGISVVLAVLWWSTKH